jgi:hypothetical protein
MTNSSENPSIFSRDHALNSTQPPRRIGESDDAYEERVEAWRDSLAAAADQAFHEAEAVKAAIEGGAYVDAGGDPRDPINRTERSALATTSAWLEASHKSRVARIAGVRAEKGDAYEEMLRQAGE